MSRRPSNESTKSSSSGVGRRGGKISKGDGDSKFLCILQSL